MAVAEFLFAVAQELGERAVDVAEAEEAEVESLNADLLAGRQRLKARRKRLRYGTPEGVP